MTICVAALAKEKDKEYIVFATDHMVTTSQGQFEHSIIKYKEINENTVAMLSGSPVLFEDLVKLDKWDGSFEEIKNEIFENFKGKKEEIIQNEIFNKFMIEKDFFIESLKQPNNNQFVGNMIKTVAEFSLKTNILLIGFDVEEGQITVVGENGCFDFRDIGFHAIGSGYDQAMNTLMFQRHCATDGLSTTIYNVYKSKKNSEVKQGVGKETELLVLSKNKIYELDDEQIEVLQDIYESELDYGKEHDDLKKFCFK